MVSRKRMRLIIAILIVTALAVLVLVMMNFKNRDGAINAADAMIEELLKCTAEDADTIVETLRLSVEDDTQLRDLFTARYGSLATDECISNLISNRAVLYSVTLAQKYESDIDVSNVKLATVYKGNIIKNLIMDCQSYTKYRPNETTGGIFVSWRRKEELPTGA